MPEKFESFPKKETEEKPKGGKIKRFFKVAPIIGLLFADKGLNKKEQAFAIPIPDKKVEIKTKGDQARELEKQGKKIKEKMGEKITGEEQGGAEVSGEPLTKEQYLDFWQQKMANEFSIDELIEMYVSPTVGPTVESYVETNYKNLDVFLKSLENMALKVLKEKSKNEPELIQEKIKKYLADYEKQWGWPAGGPKGKKLELLKKIAGMFEGVKELEKMGY